MAKYDRNFLVPYLQDICVLQLLNKKLASEISVLNEDIRKIQAGNPMNKPEKKENLETLFVTMWGIASLALGLGSIFVYWKWVFPYQKMMKYRNLDFLSRIVGGTELLFLWAILFLGVVGFIYCIGRFWGALNDKKATDRRHKQEYQNDSETYRQYELYIAKGRMELPMLQATLQQYKDEKWKVMNLLKEAYQANVIPLQYRDIYASTYLYRYFAYSREDDLSMALNTYVLEQIKQKLDEIIANQQEMLLNQRMILAEQQKTNELQRQHTQMMRSKLNQIVASNEERNQYLNMIESNTRVTAYFLASEHIIKKI